MYGLLFFIASLFLAIRYFFMKINCRINIYGSAHATKLGNLENRFTEGNRAINENEQEQQQQQQKSHAHTKSKIYKTNKQTDRHNQN